MEQVTIKVSEQKPMKGIISYQTYKAGTLKKIMPLVERYKMLQEPELYGLGKITDSQKAHMETMLEQINSFLEQNRISEPVVTENLIMVDTNKGKALIAQWLIGVTTYPVGINWGAIGTSNTAPTVTDSQLGAEVARSSPLFTQITGSNTAVLQFFFPDSSLTNTTYYEFGSFVSGTNTANSGQIFNRALLSSPFNKVSGVDTTVQLTVSN